MTNRTSVKRSGESSVTCTYTAGRLTAYADPNASITASFAYDATGQRVRSVTTQGSLTTASTYLYEGLLLQRIASERSDGTTLSLTYLFDEENDPYAAIYESGEATPVVFTLITTDRGDVRELLDADGAAFAFYGYDAFGRPTETTSTATASLDATTAAEIAAANPLRYAGYCYDGFSGLYYLSQRYYDPATAQFITKDPAKADGEESAYQYCGGDPVGKTDPSGCVPLTAMTYAQCGQIRNLALNWVNLKIPYLYGAKYFFHYYLVDKNQGNKKVDAYHRLDCSGFVQQILNEAGVQGIPKLKSSLGNAWSASSLYSNAPTKSTSNKTYFDAAKKKPFQIGDVLYKPGHIALVISNGTAPEVAECTPASGWQDGTKYWTLAKRWATWQPTQAGRYIVAYSPNIPR